MARWAEPRGCHADSQVELRLPDRGDAAALHAYASEEGGLRGMWVPLAEDASLHRCEELVKDWRAGWNNVTSVHGPALVITQPGQRQLIGQVGLGDRGNRVVELAYGIAPHYRGRGYATHAARLAARWLLEEGLASEVELRIGESHLESQRVAVTAGFTPAEVAVSRVQATGQTHNDLRFVMFPDS